MTDQQAPAGNAENGPNAVNGRQGHDVDLTVQPYFATPIVQVQLPDADELTADLRKIILEREVGVPGVEHSNIGGWQSSWDFADWAGAPGEAILGVGRQLADMLTTDREGNKANVNWKSNAWANVNRSTHANEFHTHPGSFWSAVYYVDDGGVSENHKLGGEFEAMDPRGVAPAMLAPSLAYAIPGGQSIGASELIWPQTGMMILFPSWVLHSVRAYAGDGVRISIAMNFWP